MNYNIEINKDHIVYSCDLGSYHVTPELLLEKGIELEGFILSELKLKQTSYKYKDIDFTRSRSLGFCEFGIKDFCKQLEIDIDKTYKLSYLKSKLTLKVMFGYIDEIIKLFGKDVFKPFENEISKKASYSYYYAKHVLKAPFKLGETAISKDSYYSIGMLGMY